MGEGTGAATCARGGCGRPVGPGRRWCSLACWWRRGPSRGGRRPDPSPDEVAERAAAVRAGWTGREEECRRAVPAVPWRVPTGRAHDVPEPAT